MTQVLWEEDDLYGLVVEPADRFEQTKATIRSLRAATTWAEVRNADLAPWAVDLIDSLDDDLDGPDDEDAWDYAEISESVTDAVPLSHDAHNTQSWLGRELLAAHAEVSGASPGGHSDGYKVRDQEAFLAALEAAGFEPVHRPGFFSELLRSV